MKISTVLLGENGSGQQLSFFLFFCHRRPRPCASSRGRGKRVEEVLYACLSFSAFLASFLVSVEDPVEEVRNRGM